MMLRLQQTGRSTKEIKMLDTSKLSLDTYIDIEYPWKIRVFHNVLTDEQRIDLLSLFEFQSDNPESSWADLSSDHWFYKLVENTFDQHNFVVKLKKDQAHHTLQSPHCDVIQYHRTAQIFLQDSSYHNGGTVLHATKESVGFELPLISNSMTLFDNNSKSWHSVVQRGYDRRSILIRWNK
jgi:hypothetical protein